MRPSTFEDCTSLTKVTLPETIDVIRRFAFYGCTALETIVLPESLTRVDCCNYRGLFKLKLHFPPQAQKNLIEHLVSGNGETLFYHNGEEPDHWD